MPPQELGRPFARPQDRLHPATGSNPVRCVETAVHGRPERVPRSTGIAFPALGRTPLPGRRLTRSVSRRARNSFDRRRPPGVLIFAFPLETGHTRLIVRTIRSGAVTDEESRRQPVAPMPAEIQYR